MNNNHEPFFENIKKNKYKFKILDDTITEFPLYVMIVSEIKLEQIKYSFFYCFRRNLLADNNIYLMVDTYYNNNISFHNNCKLYKTIYKKFDMNDRAYYIPVQEYSKFFLSYKTKLCNIIAETLGVEKIKYNYNKFTEKILKIDGSAGYNGIGANLQAESKSEESIDSKNTLTYSRGECKFLFSNFNYYIENIGTITKNFCSMKEINSDFELKQLIHSRLVGNLRKYEIKYETTFLDSKELKLIVDFNINIGLKYKEIMKERLSIGLDITFYKTDELINNLNMTLENNCLRLIINKEPYDINMMKNFIEKYIDTNDTNNINNYYDTYYYFKILDSDLLDTYIREVKSMDDLSDNGSFFTNLRSTLFSSLVTFDDKGLNNIQKIYLLTKRHYRTIEIYPKSECYNMRCHNKNCNCKYYHGKIKIIFCFFIRLYNNFNPNNIITYGYRNNDELCKILHYVAMNLKHITSFEMLKDMITKKIKLYKQNFDSDYSESVSNSSRDKKILSEFELIYGGDELLNETKKNMDDSNNSNSNIENIFVDANTPTIANEKKRISDTCMINVENKYSNLNENLNSNSDENKNKNKNKKKINIKKYLFKPKKNIYQLKKEETGSFEKKFAMSNS